MVVDFARETALKILYQINEKGAYSNISINHYLEEYEPKEIDKAFITELVYGTIKWKLKIDYIIEQFSSVRIKKISPWILNILRLGVCQLLFTDKIPESAACNESVNLAKRYGHAASSRYVNAVLRNIARGSSTIRYPAKDEEYEQYLSVYYSHPQWMVREWLGRFGQEFTESLLEVNNRVPEFTVRVNLLKVSKEQFMEHLNELGMQAAPGKYIEEAVTVQNPSSIFKTDAFTKGYFQVQDESSMLVAKVLDPKPGELVMDMCSAPGGKATHIAQLMGNQGKVVARDVHQHKVKIISDAAKRLGLDIIRTEVFDATQVDQEYMGMADRVLVDAPCTGLGIIRRKPDIKWARNTEDKEEIIKLQSAILDNSARCVKPGGVIVYSTCTIEREENEDVIYQFLHRNQAYEPVDVSRLLPEGLHKPTASQGYIQLFPNIDRTDGFFIAKMRRKGN